MYMEKKIISMLLCAGILLSCWCGCTQSSQDEAADVNAKTRMDSYIPTENSGESSEEVLPELEGEPEDSEAPESQSAPSQPAQPVAVAGIQLSTYEVNLSVGSSKMPIVTMSPSNASDKSEHWVSDNTGVATVDGMGRITGMSAGTCTVTVTSVSNPAVSASVKVTVTQPAPAAGSAAAKAAEARVVAQSIADQISGSSDLERVEQAAAAVAQYCQRCRYTTEGSDYSQAYGVFIKGEYSCAGATRALGMVLECMGYQWQHVNENQWTHQWCSLIMDGQQGFADGQVGWAGYGEHPVAYQ